MPKKSRKYKARVPVQSILADRLKVQFELSGVLPTVLGDKVLSAATISLIMNGHTQNPRLFTLFSIFQELDRDPGPFVQGLYEDWKAAQN